MELKKIKPIEFNITTFPRSGRTYLSSYLKNFENVTVDAYHFKDFTVLENKIKICSVCINKNKLKTFICYECNYYNKNKQNFVLEKDKNYIGIIRNPYDSIISTYAMSTFFAFKNTCNKKINDGFDSKIAIEETKNELISLFDQEINSITNYYIKYYEFYLNNFENILLLKFENIIENIELCLSNIIKYFNIDLNTHKYNYNKIILKNTNNFLVSSKNNDWYDYAIKNINNNDQIRKAEEVYNCLLNKINI